MQVLGIVGALDPHTHKVNQANIQGEGKLEAEGVRPQRQADPIGGLGGGTANTLGDLTLLTFRRAPLPISRHAPLYTEVLSGVSQQDSAFAGKLYQYWLLAPGFGAKLFWRQFHDAELTKSSQEALTVALGLPHRESLCV